LSATFNAQWAEHGAWRRGFSFLLQLFSRWLKDSALLDPTVVDCIGRLERRLGSPKVTVAFVAEFSRGKSEMINALFFADYGRRIMPASAGRTTMCPTEIGYAHEVAPSLRLLPIHTRLQPQTLQEWRQRTEAWTEIPLDMHNAEQLAGALNRVTETVQVTPQEAQALGFWHSQHLHDNPPLDAEGLVQVPAWRHALANFAHPLLKQGLVILDTPGFNAIGAEPELTIGVIEQADAIVFILGADTGVTGSDRAIWQAHLLPGLERGAHKLVVLNKIDTLWDELSESTQVQAHIEGQRSAVAQALGVQASDVLAVSAQKGLVAKVSGDAALLQASGLLGLESALAHGLLGGRHAVLQKAMGQDIAKLHAQVGRLIHAKRSELVQQQREIEGLRGQSGDVLREMRQRIAREQQELGVAHKKIQAIKTVHARLFQEIWEALDPHSLARDLDALADALAQPGLKMGVKKAYDESFGLLRFRLRRVQASAMEIKEMQMASFAQLNAEFGMALPPIPVPALDDCLMDLELTQRSHLSYLGLRNVLRLQQLEFRQRLVSALSTRLSSLVNTVRSDAARWRDSVAALLDAQIRLQLANFENRLATIETVGNATTGLAQRLDQMADLRREIDALDARLQEQTALLNAANEDH
jgi:hypothetical protein